MSALSTLSEALLKKPIALPRSLRALNEIGFSESNPCNLQSNLLSYFTHLNGQPHLKQTKQTFTPSPIKVGVVFSGGQAPGGHNVLCGLLDALKGLHQESSLLGFRHGPSGLLNQDYLLLDEKTIQPFRNLGGFHLIGSGRTKIESKEQLDLALKAAQALKLDAFVIIGGDDSNTNAAVLAEFFLSKNQKTAVIGVPKTIDGDLKNPSVEVSFGFDTASSLYSELIGNLLMDALSSQKYYHFVKLMGRSASHLTLECALRTRPNAALIGEEIKAKNISLREITQNLVEMILMRHNQQKNYGLILIPEGLIDFIPEFRVLNHEINHQLADHKDVSIEECKSHLSKESLKTFETLPLAIQHQLLLERDPHGNLPLAKIETGKLLVSLIEKELQKHKDVPFKPLNHYFGYEGRSSHPSPFDAHYCYALGYSAALLATHQKTGYMACVKHLTQSIDQWELGGLPIISLLNIEERNGKEKPVIKKALVNLEGESFKLYVQNRKRWALEDHFESPGPMQLLRTLEECPERNFLLQTQSIQQRVNQ